MSVTDNVRPPYVKFERKPVEDRTASLAAGHYVAKDVDFAVITRPGDRDSLEIEATQWLASLKGKARSGIVPEQWASGFVSAYENWKKGEETPISGTPIKGWPVMSPAAQEGIIRAGFLTVEDLANAPDSSVALIGTGGLSYKIKAQTWLKSAQDHGVIAEQVASLTQKLSDLTALTERLMAENKELKATSPKLATLGNKA